MELATKTSPTYLMWAQMAWAIQETNDAKEIMAWDPSSLGDNGLGLIKHGRHGKVYTKKESHGLVHLSRRKDPIQVKPNPYENKHIMDSLQGVIGLYEWNITISYANKLKRDF